ncbi:hypothetical protein V1477_012737 [Vespula maculifrons]|uniref:Uncharacterized protein n=1 Tax=Vespula maculifrons TaxID=7453 RepID=A0ABD2BTW2_VESMC
MSNNVLKLNTSKILRRNLSTTIIIISSKKKSLRNNKDYLVLMKKWLSSRGGLNEIALKNLSKEIRSKRCA